jgi:hypothetical protein
MGKLFSAYTVPKPVYRLRDKTLDSYQGMPSGIAQVVEIHPALAAEDRSLLHGCRADTLVRRP